MAQATLVHLNDTLSVRKLIVEHLLGKGVGKVSNILIKGDPQSVGLYREASGVIGFQNGFAISTGLVEQIAGPNSRPNAGANLGGHFFVDENLLAKSKMCDGVVIEFEFVPSLDSLCFDFVFGSDEYPEFVGKEFNDLFGFYVWEKTSSSKPRNLALLPNGTYINVNSINHKNNSEWYVANDKIDAPAYDLIEWDGYTKPITIGLRVKPGVTYVFKMVIADLTDCEYDSGIIIRANSFRTTPTRVKPIKRTYYFNFDNNEAKLDEVGTKRLNKLCDSIASHRFDSIIVVGYTDSIGNAMANLELSNQRALFILNKLQDCNKSVIRARGLGASKPIATNRTEQGRAANRRVEIIYYPRPE